jgi:hypothetical protein
MVRLWRIVANFARDSCRSVTDYSFRHAFANWTRLCGAIYMGCRVVGVLSGGDVHYAVEGEAGICVRED